MQKTEDRAEIMDSVSIKDLLPVIAGAMALIGGLFTFINGRLQEAQTQEAKRNVVNWVLLSGGIIFSLLGLLLAIIFPHLRILIPVFFVSAIITNLILFVRRS